MSNLTVNPKEFGIEETQALELTIGLNPILEDRAKLIERFNEIKDLEPTPENIEVFRKLRLEFQKNRTQGVNQWHKVVKEIPLRMGQLVDAVNRNESQTNKNYEEPLEAKEKHFERLEEQRIEALNKERIELVAKCGVDGTHLQLGSMTPDVWEAYYSGVVSKFEQEQERIAREEQERQKQIKIEQLHNKRKEIALPFYEFWDGLEKTLNFGEQSEDDFNNFIAKIKKAKSDNDAQIEAQKIENERLKKEAEAKEKALEVERAKAKKEADELEAKRQAELKAERDKQAKLEAELKAKKDAEEQAEKDRLAKIEADKKEAEKLAKAPIKKQLENWVNLFESPISPMQHEKVTLILEKFETFKKWSKEQIESL
jgi:hypothetical protein